MECGKAYRELIVTEDGATPEEPWEYFAGEFDYLEWHDLVQKLDAQLTKRRNDHDALMAQIALQRLQGDAIDPYEFEGNLNRRSAEYDADRDRLPSKLRFAAIGIDNEGHINGAVRVTEQAACLMQLLDESHKHYTGREYLSAHFRTDPPMTTGTKIALALGGAAVLGTGLALALRRQG